MIIMEKKCRFCNESLKVTFADLGTSPLSNSFLKKSDLTKKESSFPLHVYVCSNCFLVQLEEFKSPDKTLFIADKLFTKLNS